MGKLIIALSLIIVAGYMVTTYVTGNNDSIKSESTRIGNSGITQMKNIQ